MKVGTVPCPSRCARPGSRRKRSHSSSSIRCGPGGSPASRRTSGSSSARARAARRAPRGPHVGRSSATSAGRRCGTRSWRRARAERPGRGRAGRCGVLVRWWCGAPEKARAARSEGTGRLAYEQSRGCPVGGSWALRPRRTARAAPGRQPRRPAGRTGRPWSAGGGSSCRPAGCRSRRRTVPRARESPARCAVPMPHTAIESLAKTMAVGRGRGRAGARWRQWPPLR